MSLKFSELIIWCWKECPNLSVRLLLLFWNTAGTLKWLQIIDGFWEWKTAGILRLTVQLCMWTPALLLPLMLLETVSRTVSVGDPVHSHTHIRLCDLPLDLWLERRGPLISYKGIIRNFTEKGKFPGMATYLGWTRRTRRWRTHTSPHSAFRLSRKETWFRGHQSSGGAHLVKDHTPWLSVPVPYRYWSVWGPSTCFFHDFSQGTSWWHWDREREEANLRKIPSPSNGFEWMKSSQGHSTQNQ